MGREIRRVPADWEHPRYTANDAPYSNRVGEFRPLYDEDYETACREWYEGAVLWAKGEHPDQSGGYAAGCKFYHEWHGNPPDEGSYRDRAWTEEEATHYQIYETVSEGTPVTPAFATKEELAEYLVENGDFWDQKRGHGGWCRKAAESFVNAGFAPSMMVTVGAGGADIREPRDGLSEDRT